MAIATPQTVAEITPTWIEEVLRSAGAIAAERVAGIETRPIGEGQGFLSSMAVVAIQYDRDVAGAPAGVVVKLEPAAGTFRDTERETKAFAREVDFYRDVSPVIDVRVPRVYYAVAGDAGMALVMEDLSHLRSGDQLRGMQHDEVLATFAKSRECMRRSGRAAGWPRSTGCRITTRCGAKVSKNTGRGSWRSMGVRLGREALSWGNACGRIWIGSSSESRSVHRH